MKSNRVKANCGTVMFKGRRYLNLFSLKNDTNKLVNE